MKNNIPAKTAKHERIPFVIQNNREGRFGLKYSSSPRGIAASLSRFAGVLKARTEIVLRRGSTTIVTEFERRSEIAASAARLHQIGDGYL